jgi:hypothetical protein
MRTLYSLPCALDKVTMLRQEMLVINTAVERAITDGSIPANVMVGSDDLLPLVIYVLVQSCAADLGAPTAQKELHGAARAEDRPPPPTHGSFASSTSCCPVAGRAERSRHVAQRGAGK